MASILLITSSFPFGKKETFLEEEIKYLSKSFNIIYILPLSNNENKKRIRTVPENVVILSPLYHQHGNNVIISNKIMSFPPMIVPFFSEIIKTGNYKKNIIPALDRLIFTTGLAGKLYKEIIKILTTNRIDLIYSYWMNYSVLSSIMAKKRMQSSIPLISRIHGYDLYWERQDPPFCVYQRLMMEGADRVFPISEHGREYLIKKYPNLIDKIHVHRLGVKKGKPSEPSKDGIIRIVSCSSVISHKRLPLIIDTLKNVEVPIKWTHIGDGPDMPIVASMAKEVQEIRRNVHIELKGSIPNSSVHNFFETNNVDFFISVSETEGIPVSIMEALSHSIPVMACDVGGIHEIIGKDKGAGLLLDQDISSEMLLRNIIDYSDISRNIQERNRSRQLWEMYCNSHHNYGNFINELNRIIKSQ